MTHSLRTAVRLALGLALLSTAGFGQDAGPKSPGGGLSPRQAPKTEPAPKAPGNETPSEPAQAPDKDATPPATPTPADSTDSPTTEPTTVPVNAALRFTLKQMDGTEIDLMTYRRRAILIIPIAWDSNRRQFEETQRLATHYRDLGLVTLGVLTQDFNKTPDARSDADIIKAIKDRYSITFPLLPTTKVTGDDAHPLFKFLATHGEDGTPGTGGPLKGTFTKFFIGRDGRVAARIEPETRLTDPKLRQTITDVMVPIGKADEEPAGENKDK